MTAPSGHTVALGALGALGSPTAGRLSPDVEGLVGMFVNMLTGEPPPPTDARGAQTDTSKLAGIFAINQMLAWSTLPIGFGVVAPLGTTLLEPLLTPDGALSGSVGAVIGVGEGRGIGLLYVVFGIAMLIVSLVAMRMPRFARFDIDTPDAQADDLVGAQQSQDLVGAGTRT